jgi:aspartate/methionine/tyrosine aminotransferase
VQYTPEEVLISNGGKQCIAQAVMAMCQPGDEVIVPAPYWVSYPEIVKLAGATPVIVDTTAEDDYLLTPQALRDSITSRTRMLILCNPSNPTGAVYPLEMLEGIADVVSQHESLLVLSDEIYEKITFDLPHYSFAAIKDMRERTIVVNGVSKAFAMTGLRLGFIAAPQPVKAACLKIQGQLTSCASSISQASAAVALTKVGATFFEEAAQTFREKRDFVLAALRDIPLMECPVPQGAFYVFPTVSAYFGYVTPEGDILHSAADLCLYLLRCGVALVPGEAFGTPACLRISYATDKEKLTLAMERIQQGLAALSPPSSSTEQ